MRFGGKEDMEGGTEGHRKNEKRGERSANLAEEQANSRDNEDRHTAPGRIYLAKRMMQFFARRRVW